MSQRCYGDQEAPTKLVWLCIENAPSTFTPYLIEMDASWPKEEGKTKNHLEEND